MKDAVDRFQTVAVLGGGSEIAAATLKALARDGGYTAILCAREPEAIDTAELEALGVRIERRTLDALARESHPAFVDGLFDRPDDIDLVIVAFGLLGVQEEAEHDPEAADAIIQTNFAGAVSLIGPIAERLVAQGHGALVVLSSVAAVRARRSNYLYGAAKAGLDAFCQGLQMRLAGTGVDLTIVRPGFVKTKMTDGLAAMPLSVEADDVAAAIVSGLGSRAPVVWVPAAMRLAAVVLRLLPSRLIARL